MSCYMLRWIQLKGKYLPMGNEQPKKISRVTKDQINVGCLKARIHLELVRDRKNNELIKGEKQLLAKMKSKNRNKTEEVLIAQRVVNGLKYAQACNLLIGYAATLRGQAHLISQNMMNPQKMQPFLVMIYSLIFAADQMGLSSLAEFKALMRALNDPTTLQKYVNQQLLNALMPSPSAEELNMYMLEFSERNQVPLQQINIAGHNFTKEWKNIPSVQPVQPRPSNLNDLQYKINDPYGNKRGGQNDPLFNPYKKMDPNQLVNNPNNTPSNNNFGGIGNNQNNFNPNNNFGGNGNNQNNFTPNNFGGNGNNQNNFGGNGNNPNNLTPNNYGGNALNNNGNTFIGSNGNTGNNFGSNPYDNSSMSNPANMGPNFYVPVEIAPRKIDQPNRTSINSLDDIDYYPQIDAQGPMFNKGVEFDPSFEQICERLKKGL